jgi:hypothetical protein
MDAAKLVFWSEEKLSLSSVFLNNERLSFSVAWAGVGYRNYLSLLATE